MMKPADLEDLTLFLLRDADEAEMWIDRWLVSYPIVAYAECRISQSPAEQQQQVAKVFAGIVSDNVMVVAHGAAVAAFMGWYGTLTMLQQRRMRAVMLVAPVQSACRSDAVRYVRLVCAKAALVMGEQDNDCPADWAAEQAARWGARLLVSPHRGHLNGTLGGWQWGSKLMQEMLLA